MVMTGSGTERIASAALRSRLISTCSSRMESARTSTGVSGMLRMISIRLCPIWGAMIASAADTQVRTSTSPNSDVPLRAKVLSWPVMVAIRVIRSSIRWKEVIASSGRLRFISSCAPAR